MSDSTPAFHFNQQSLLGLVSAQERGLVPQARPFRDHSDRSIQDSEPLRPGTRPAEEIIDAALKGPIRGFYWIDRHAAHRIVHRSCRDTQKMSRTIHPTIPAHSDRNRIDWDHEGAVR